MYQKQLDDIFNRRRKSESLASEAVQQHWKENRKSWKIKRNINFPIKNANIANKIAICAYKNNFHI